MLDSRASVPVFFYCSDIKNGYGVALKQPNLNIMDYTELCS